MEILTLHIHEINSKAGARIVPEALDYFQCDYNEFIVNLTKLLLTYYALQDGRCFKILSARSIMLNNFHFYLNGRMTFSDYKKL